jgi:hypothetical protein
VREATEAEEVDLESALREKYDVSDIDNLTFYELNKLASVWEGWHYDPTDSEGEPGWTHEKYRGHMFRPPQYCQKPKEDQDRVPSHKGHHALRLLGKMERSEITHTEDGQIHVFCTGTKGGPLGEATEENFELAVTKAAVEIFLRGGEPSEYEHGVIKP